MAAGSFSYLVTKVPWSNFRRSKCSQTTGEQLASVVASWGVGMIASGKGSVELGGITRCAVGVMTEERESNQILKLENRPSRHKIMSPQNSFDELYT